MTEQRTREEITDWREAAKIPRSLPLDGIRGAAVTILILYHFGFEWIQGAWIGINLFFVFSGYVIVMLLLKQHAKTGRVPVIDFYRRRLRRLLPALFLLIATVAVWGFLWAPDEVRRPLKGDILATMGFVQNWRLIEQSDQYFAMFGTPSFFRHLWTLSVEEQFYIFIPFVVMALIWYVRSRTMRVGIVFALACVSAWRMSEVGLDGAGAMAHAYYGTDTRVQALLVGVMAAFMFGPDAHGRRPKPWPYPAVFLGGWVSLLISIYAIFTVPLFTPFMFEQGGLFALSLLLVVGIPATVDKRPSVFIKLFSLPPLVYLGTLVYSLYLWHWPVMLWVNMYRPDLDGFWLAVVGCVLTFIPAAISFHLFELRILFSGVQSFTGTLAKARLVTFGSIAALAIAAFAVANVPSVEEQIAKGDIPPLTPGLGEYVPGESVRVLLYGDSVPDGLGQNFPSNVYTDIDLQTHAVGGCDLIDMPMRVSDTAARSPEQDCRQLHQDIPGVLATAQPDALVIMTGSMLGAEHEGSSGYVDIESAEMVDAIRQRLDELLDAALAAGVRSIQIVTAPCRDVDSNVIALLAENQPDVRAYVEANGDITRRLADPVEVNRIFTDWAEENAVDVVDLYGALNCDVGYVPAINGIELYSDAFHFSTPASAMVWSWLAPSIVSNAHQSSGTR